MWKPNKTFRDSDFQILAFKIHVPSLKTFFNMWAY